MWSLPNWGWLVGRENFKVSHLQHADNTMLFLIEVVQGLKNVKSIFPILEVILALRQTSVSVAYWAFMWIDTLLIGLTNLWGVRCSPILWPIMGVIQRWSLTIKIWLLSKCYRLDCLKFKWCLLFPFWGRITLSQTCL